MSVCCPPVIQMFADVPNSTIIYSDTMKANYGSDPNIDVYYFDEDLNEFYTDNGTPSSGTQIQFDGTNIKIDHGGPSSGFIKIS